MRRIRIGRSETNDIVIPDASVSRQHAEAVELGDGRFSLTDLGSTFGTQVWIGQNWVAAKETAIDPDTVLRFGEFRTTLRDVLSEADRMALGLARAAPPPEPPPPPPTPKVPPPPKTAAPSGPVEPEDAPKPAPRTAAPAPPPPQAPAPRAPSAEQRPPVARDARAAARGRPTSAGSKRRALMLGLLATAAFFALAAGVVVLALTIGDPGGELKRDARGQAGEGQRRFLETCTANWGIEERRCRCFLAAAGPYLDATDYDDFAALVQGHIDGNSTQMESVLEQAGEKRGTRATARLSAAMKGVTRDCAR